MANQGFFQLKKKFSLLTSRSFSQISLYSLLVTHNLSLSLSPDLAYFFSLPFSRPNGSSHSLLLVNHRVTLVGTTRWEDPESPGWHAGGLPTAATEGRSCARPRGFKRATSQVGEIPASFQCIDGVGSLPGPQQASSTPLLMKNG